ncbi:MAG: SPFH domain-containing protein [Oscillospiraceae bacterium]|nr:SPFH domain-containing protein [Oscillospiraceae bacterium]
MGLIKIALGAVSGTLADQFKEFFYCDSIRNDILVVKGQKRTGKGSGNHGSDNIISSGSGIAVADGQCMMIVEQGRVVDVCAVPGEYQYDMSSEPSLFTGSLGEGIIETLKTIGNRIAHGGDTGKDQRVYYFNTKEITDNKFGTQNPVPFRIVDNKIGLDIDTSVRCNGAYSYKITDPVLFYTNVCGNIAQEYNRSEIDSMMKTEFRDALQPAFAKISAMGIRYNELPGHTTELSETMNEILSQKWSELRGISIVSVGINSITIPPEDEALIKNAQRTAMMRDPNFAAATLVDAQAEAMKTAAGNSAGTMAGFMNMNMAGAAGGFNAQNLFAMGQQQAASQQAAAPAGSWTCSCGTVNTGKFCSECASPKPAPAGQWTCSCGTVNTGKFCSECASPRPSAEWTCSCGAVNTGKFCSECASPRP